MATTKLANLFNPEVVAAMISAKLPKAIRFSPFATIDNTLAGQPGDTITVPKFAYIGDAEDVEEGADIPLTALTHTTQTKAAGAAISYNGIVDAVDLFEEETPDPFSKVMFINSKQMTTIRKDANSLSLDKYPAPKGAVALPALTIYMKRGV